MKKQVIQVSNRLQEVLKDIEELSSDPNLSKRLILEEKFSTLVSNFSLKVKYMLKCLHTLSQALPKEPREKTKLVNSLKKVKRVSNRVLELSKVINPHDREFVWGSGRYKTTSRKELAEILLLIRKLERQK